VMLALPFCTAAGQTAQGGTIMGVTARGSDQKSLLAEGNHNTGDAISRVPPADVSPKSIAVMQAYPNPSSGAVSFEFMVDADARVIMDLYNTSGARVATIFNADVQAGMTQTVRFDNSLSEGLYIYILRCNNERLTGKLVIKR
jgi:hypothetical protein